MKALTIRQPHAQLVAVGAKTIETRGFATAYRGPLLIHAGLTVDWPASHRPEVERALHERGACVVDITQRGNPALGAVVASCQLIGCLPIVDRRLYRYDPDQVTINVTGKAWYFPVDGPSIDISDQVPFGDFTPDRYAWLLDDVKPTTERCPRCWGSGTIDGWPLPWEGSAISRPMTAFEQNPPVQKRCPTCITEQQPFIGEGACEPVPMRGRQGLWTPSTEDWPT